MQRARYLKFYVYFWNVCGLCAYLSWSRNEMVHMYNMYILLLRDLFYRDRVWYYSDSTLEGRIRDVNLSQRYFISQYENFAWKFFIRTVESFGTNIFKAHAYRYLKMNFSCLFYTFFISGYWYFSHDRNLRLLSKCDFSERYFFYKFYSVVLI